MFLSPLPQGVPRVGPDSRFFFRSRGFGPDPEENWNSMLILTASTVGVRSAVQIRPHILCSVVDSVLLYSTVTQEPPYWGASGKVPTEAFRGLPSAKGPYGATVLLAVAREHLGRCHHTLTWLLGTPVYPPEAGLYVPPGHARILGIVIPGIRQRTNTKNKK